ncbi:MAG: cell division protein FtsX [Melioribacteraceae bacterium]
MILFYLKETARIFRKSSFATIVTITITTIAVSLMTISLFLVFSTKTLSDQIKRSIEVNVYLEDSLNKADIQTIESSIKQISAVQSVQFISKDDAVKKFLAETGEDFRKVIDQNPLPNSLVVKFQPQSLDEINIEQFTDQFKKINGVTDVVYDYKTVLRILNFLRSFKYVIYILSVILILLSIYLVYSNNKIQMYGNRNLYLTMKLVGAVEKTMKIPIIINGLFIGLISSVFTLLIFHGVLILLTKIYYNIKFIMYLEFMDILIPVIGVLLGFIGSFISSFKLSNLLHEK